jgi:hypothetical protein
MTQALMAEAASAAANVNTPSITPPAQALPDQSRAVDVADFERLLSQAQAEQSHVEFANPAGSMAGPGVAHVTRSIASSSSDYLGAVNNGLESLSRLDLKDSKSIADTMQSFTVATVQGVQLTIMLGEVSSSKKSVQELFHSQG